MEIKKEQNGNELTVSIIGRLDTTTAPQLEAELRGGVTGVEKLILDMKDLEYLSSAGLRVILAAQKVMNKQGEMVVRNVNDTIREIFEVTGFIDILTIEYCGDYCGYTFPVPCIPVFSFMGHPFIACPDSVHSL